jgi:hypothetical protein
LRREGYVRDNVILLVMVSDIQICCQHIPDRMINKK